MSAFEETKTSACFSERLATVPTLMALATRDTLRRKYTTCSRDEPQRLQPPCAVVVIYPFINNHDDRTHHAQ